MAGGTTGSAPAAPAGATGTTPSAAPAVDSYAPLPGVEATVTPGLGYGNQTTIRDTDKRNGKIKSLLNVPASRA